MKNRLLPFILLLIMLLTFTACNKNAADAPDAFHQESIPGSEELMSSPTITPYSAPSPTPAISVNTPSTTGSVEAVFEPGITPAEVEVKITLDYENLSDNPTPILMPSPTFSHYYHGQIPVTNTVAVELKQVSSKTNQITDVEEWFVNHDLMINSYQVPNEFRNITGDLPAGVERTIENLIITSAFYDSSYFYCTYGSDFSEGYIMKIYDLDTLRPFYNLDFSNYRYAPDYVSEDYSFIQQKINWAEIKDHILYISQSHNTYAESSNYMNAYITAIDLSDMSILWRTDALVSNSNNFVILDDVIISGYGFTAEPDFLYLIDRLTGKVLEQLPVKSAPSYLIQKDNILYVRTYNMDYEFEIVP